MSSVIKIVQSFWTNPSFRQSVSKQKFDRFQGGWIDNTSHLMSWALSCLQLKSLYEHVELVTDYYGKHLLIDILKLPYTSVSLQLEELPSNHGDLWALGKIYAYRIQTEPFIHVDSDVYIWSPFGRKIENAELICQNFDADHVEYHRMMKLIDKEKFVVPAAISDERKLNQSIVSCNAGIFGGNDLVFFKQYTDMSLQFVMDNLKQLRRLKEPAFNIIFEQYLFYCLAKKNNIEIATYYKDIDHGIAPTQYVNFKKTPVSNKYVHMIANFKKDYALNERMKQVLRFYHPEYYFRILGLRCNSYLV